MKKPLLIFYCVCCALTVTVLILAARQYILKTQAQTLVVVVEASDSTRVEEQMYSFETELVRSFADSAGYALQITEESDLNKAIEMLADGKCDLVARLVPVTEQYADLVAFSQPLMFSRAVLVQCQPPVEKQYDLADDTIVMPLGSPFVQRIMNLSDEIAAPITVIEIADSSAMDIARAVAQGKYRFTVLNQQLAQDLKKTFPNVDITLPIGFEQAYCWAVAADNKTLLEKINVFLTNNIKN